MSKERRLGRGLEALVGADSRPQRTGIARPTQPPLPNAARRASPQQSQTSLPASLRGRARAAAPISLDIRPCGASAELRQSAAASAGSESAWQPASRTARPMPVRQSRCESSVRPDRQQSGPAAAGVRRRRDASRWPRAFRPTGCCSRSSSAGWTIATS